MYKVMAFTPNSHTETATSSHEHAEAFMHVLVGSADMYAVFIYRDGAFVKGWTNPKLVGEQAKNS